MQFEHSRVIDASAATIFAIYADVANWPMWDPDAKSASIEGPFVSGAIGQVVPHGGPTSKLHFTQVVDQKSFQVQCKLPLCTMRFDYGLQPKGAATLATHRVTFEGLLAPVFGRLIGSGMRKTLPKALDQLAALSRQREGAVHPAR
jgi:hypothetical protein